MGPPRELRSARGVAAVVVALVGLPCCAARQPPLPLKPCHPGVCRLSLCLQAVFKEYYDTKTNKRVLNWSPATSNASVKAVIGKSTYDLAVTAMQAAALVLFADKAPGSPATPFGEIVSALGCEVEVAKRIVHSLACGKYRVRAVPTLSPWRTAQTAGGLPASSRLRRASLRPPPHSLCPRARTRLPRPAGAH